jgi:hypothetical protein
MMAQRLRWFALSIVLLVASCVPPGQQGRLLTGPLPPVPPGMARIVLYRPLEYYTTNAMTMAYLNRAPAGVTQNGGVFYRDVAPGQYDISVDSPGPYPNQFKSVVVGPGNVVYARIGLLPKPPCPGGQFFGGLCPPDTFIVTIVDPVMGFQEVHGLRYLG